MQTYDIFSKYIFYLCFFLIGLTQSVVFPILVSIIGAYFSKSKRGMVAGIWATSTNVGNIIGLQTASYL
jgi:sugar phosphate permease